MAYSRSLFLIICTPICSVSYIVSIVPNRSFDLRNEYYRCFARVSTAHPSHACVPFARLTSPRAQSRHVDALRIVY